MKTVILTFMSILFLGSCSKDDENLTPAGIETRIYGKITSQNNEPISNLIIKIGEYKESGGANYPSAFGNTHIELIQFVKEVFTDSQGNYDFIFKTSGRGNFYKVIVGEKTLTTQPQIYWDPYGFNLSQFGNDMTIIGKSFNHNYEGFLKLYPCEINIQFNNIQYFPIIPIHDKTYKFNLIDINTNQNTSRKIYIDKFSNQTFELFRVKPNGTRQKATYLFPASNVETLTVQNIIVNEIDFIDI